MIDTKYTKKLTKTIEFDFWFEDEEKACEYLSLTVEKLQKTIADCYESELVNRLGFDVKGITFYSPKRNKEYYLLDADKMGAIKFKVTEKWG